MAIEVYISQVQIEKKVKELAAQINADYHGKEVVLVGVLTGSFIFCADLVRYLTIKNSIEFISASSYEGATTTSSGNVKINLDLKRDIAGKHIILIEDIVDTGLTITQLTKMLKSRNPASMKLASLLFKKVRVEHPLTIDYLGFEIEDKFVIGYGLDYDGYYRELPYIGVYKA
ncbi:MAG: hypoxanthine phosphoribosyltransferase [Bdellovibrionales bacterium RIFOXYD12_FULL_39_22]|nr:MAG: hypoxanthine phosphoribosyltransferase [Bdellovibrionales bacterium RIFOXYB1_FULL_39_21]OFZ40998.1 MAG: hypoxanthine phosphoribosyltransferase [Bdellovibrionales bacterium RIFOXYC12_FULL_39_17]OFZ44826.1 MAG: hypoxanthine phosphoribosyltransferase [Bdellovibrionales bacterium RIFOXYC1_FULL_39_130]OFZ68385.1 MAG: hypoxanthine phosphoribosyltransferase [Bdellovibrionales bacterium RIFOXYC2_FULL_39_8]OFZ74291.1 MAG: hypoxanthine phosphoribosyltransferase [Bdellovibrionales bacterium RIFOXY